MTPSLRSLERLPRWAILLLVAIIARAATFGNPIVHVDESFYFATARSMLDGALPYVDVWDRKPIGLFLLYVPAALFGLPLGIWVYQAMALAAVVATALLIARLADRAGWRRGSLAGAIAYIVWLDLLEGQGGQAPVFYNLLMVGAAALIASSDRDHDPRSRLRRGLGAMLLVGVALQIKYSVVFEGLFFGLWWLWREAMRRRHAVPMLAEGALLAVVALIPTALALVYYQAIGQGAAYLYANFTSIAARRPDPMGEQFGNLAQIVLITSPLFAAAILALPRGHWEGIRGWLFAWLVAAVFGLLVFGSWFDHYALPVLVPLSICAAGFADDPRRSPRITAAVLLIALLGGEATVIAKRLGRGGPGQFADVVAAVGRGPGCLYVYSGEPMLYPATGRCRLSPYVFPSHLVRKRERGAIGVDQQAEIERILALKPAVVVMRLPFNGERPELRALVIARMAAGYDLKVQKPLGRDTISVFAARPDR
ncbi:hypothetical protein FPZ24_00595 [Sphingomonas panacisoli]|uniref:Glycosyltransferase RgtA/B/C/D-like domain-containing protein n=1 Tax=Sphingomonas panacisoli TaxID=1813879 RepID=A0A5B8LDL0_9SPHN|nr:hypothetical protein [Sphingomonas panacisoli]QDZ06153.1 hypothetical protein FPZ24_00595 [Sphingomonas panacisoli]